MKITDLRTFVVGNPPPRLGGRYFIFLKLLTDGGVEGICEVYAATFAPQALKLLARAAVTIVLPTSVPVPVMTSTSAGSLTVPAGCRGAAG